MDKEVPGEPRGPKSVSTVPPRPAIVKAGKSGRTRIRRSSVPPVKKASLVAMASRYSLLIPTVDPEALEEYKAVSEEIEGTLNQILGIKKGLNPKERAVPRLRPIDGDCGVPSEKIVSIRKERIISKFREMRDHFCITFNEKRTATKIINNLDKGCPGSIDPREKTSEGSTLLNAILVMLKEARDFAKQIWEAEEFTRIDEKLDKYDELVSEVFAREKELAKDEEKSGKIMVLKRREGSQGIGRKELMNWFKENMLGEIKLDEKGEEIYHSPETLEYLGKMGEVDDALLLAKDVRTTLEVGEAAIYVERRKPFSVVQDKPQE